MIRKCNSNSVSQICPKKCLELGWFFLRGVWGVNVFWPNVWMRKVSANSISSCKCFFFRSVILLFSSGQSDSMFCGKTRHLLLTNECTECPKGVPFRLVFIQFLVT